MSYSKDGVCTEPTTPVENCFSYSGESTCFFCEFGYVLKDGKCEEISIDKCLILNNKDTSQCAVCKDSLLVTDAFKCDGDKKCPQDNCENCTSELCAICKSSFSLNTEGKCVKAPTDNCSNTEKDEAKCKSCLPGYYDSDGKCLKGVGRVVAGVAVVLFVLFSF